MAATMMVKNHPWPESSRIWAAYRWSYLCLAEGSQVFWKFLAQDNWQNKEHWESHSLQPRCSWAGSDTCSDRVGMALPSCPPCHTTRLALASLGDKVIYLSLKPPVRMTAQRQSSWTSCGHLWRTAEHRKENTSLLPSIHTSLLPSINPHNPRGFSSIPFWDLSPAQHSCFMLPLRQGVHCWTQTETKCLKADEKQLIILYFVIKAVQTLRHSPYKACCHDSAEQSNAKLLPLPVGLSSKQCCLLFKPLTIFKENKSNRINKKQSRCV